VIDKAELRRMSQAERQELASLLAELGAFLAFAGARRLLRATVAAGIQAGARAQAGISIPTAQQAPRGMRDRAGPGRSLRRTPLAGAGLDEALPRSRRSAPGRAGRSAGLTVAAEECRPVG
jgi:hypothetical protein